MDDRTLADANLVAEQVAVMQHRLAVLELRAKVNEEEIRNLKRDLRALTKEPPCST